MAGESNAITLVGYKVDNASVNAAVESNRRVAESYKAVKLEAMSLADRVKVGGAAGIGLTDDELRQASAYLGVEVEITEQVEKQIGLRQRLLDEQQRQTRQLIESETARLRVGDLTGRGGGRNSPGNLAIQNSLLRSRQALVALPGIGPQSPLPRALQFAESAVRATGASLTQLGLAAGITGGALVAVAIAFEHFNKTLEGSKKLLTGALSAQTNYYDALQNLTTEQVQEQVAELDRVRPILQQQRDETQRALDSAFAQAVAEFGDPAARSLDAAGKLPTAALREQLAGIDAALEDNIQTGVRYQQGLEDNAFAQNDAADAAERYREASDAFQEAQRRREQQNLDAEIGVAREIQTLTTEERDARVAAIELEIEALRPYEEASQDAATAIQQLKKEQELLNAVNETAADILQRRLDAEDALTERNDAQIDLTEQYVAAQEEAFAIQEKILAIEAERDERIREIEADRADRLLEITEGSEERRIEIIEDANDRIAKITRDAGRAISEAIGNRDANAFRLAELQRKDALDDQKTALDKALKQVTKNLEKQEKALEKSYRKQLDNVVDASNKQLQVQYNALTQQNFLIQSAMIAQAAHVQSGFQLMVSGTVTGMLLMQNVVTVGFLNIVGLVQGILNNALGGFTPIMPPGGGGSIGGGGMGGFNARVTRIAQQTARTTVYGYLRDAKLVNPL